MMREAAQLLEVVVRICWGILTMRKERKTPMANILIRLYTFHGKINLALERYSLGQFFCQEAWAQWWDFDKMWIRGWVYRRQHISMCQHFLFPHSWGKRGWKSSHLMILIRIFDCRSLRFLSFEAKPVISSYCSNNNFMMSSTGSGSFNRS